MKTIQIKHPTLDDGRVVEVPEQSWPHYSAAGWLRADEPELVVEDLQPAVEPPADASPSRRSRTTKED